MNEDPQKDVLSHCAARLNYLPAAQSKRLKAYSDISFARIDGDIDFGHQDNISVGIQ